VKLDSVLMSLCLWQNIELPVMGDKTSFCTYVVDLFYNSQIIDNILLSFGKVYLLGYPFAIPIPPSQQFSTHFSLQFV